jgi:asparaginyl-tRNA synthetase
MERIYLKELNTGFSAYDGKTVTVMGWARTIRDSKAFGFIDLNDGSCFKGVQVVFEREKIANYDEIAKLNVGSAVIVKGLVVLTPENKQPFEIKAISIDVEGESTPDYPLQKKRHSLEYLREIGHLRPRTNTIAAVMRIRSRASFAIHQFFQSKGFYYIHTPLISASDCEGAGQMFQVTTLPLEKVPTENGEVDYSKDFFGKKTSLTVSGQLEAEIYATAMGNCYTFGPTFRAEHSNTTRHLAEFWMIEPEMAFCDIDGDMDIAESFLKYVISDVMDNCGDDLNFLNQWIDKSLLERLQHICEKPFARITYTQAIDELEKAINSGVKFEFPVKWGNDLQSEHERYLTENVYKCPVTVTGYPKEIKAFYMKLNDDKKTVRAMDILVPGIGEIIGGSEREENYDILLGRIKELGLDEKDYSWYLELRKFGTVPHAGFGLGFERLILLLTGMQNIRDVIPFPRTFKNAEF